MFKSNSYHIYRVIFYLVGFLILMALAVRLYAFVTESFGSFWDYSSFEISDWLINYEGGFVRRGLVGQILYGLYQLHPYPVRYAIVGLYIIGYLALGGLLVCIFKKQGWSIFLLPFTICLYYGFTCDLLWMRRDAWSLLITMAIFYYYIKYSQSTKPLYLFLTYAFAAFTLLMHEAAFFYTFPVLMLHSLYTNVQQHHSIIKAILRICTLWCPVILILLFVAIHKGDADTMNAIWASWQDCFHTYPTSTGEMPNVGNGVDFLNRTSSEAIKFHFGLVWMARFAPYVPSAPFNIYLFLCTYYLITRLNTLDMRFYPLKPFDNIQLSNIVIVQFVFLIPMFGFLSCDLGRVFPYWTISSLLLFYVLTKSKTALSVPPFINKWSTWLQHKIDGVSLLNKAWFYCLIIVTLPLNCYYGATYTGIIPMQYLLKVLKYIPI